MSERSTTAPAQINFYITSPTNRNNCYALKGKIQIEEAFALFPHCPLHLRLSSSSPCAPQITLIYCLFADELPPDASAALTGHADCLKRLLERLLPADSQHALHLPPTPPPHSAGVSSPFTPGACLSSQLLVSRLFIQLLIFGPLQLCYKCVAILTLHIGRSTGLVSAPVGKPK